jgi:ribosomal protein L21
MNEHQLAIGETTYTGNVSLIDTTGIIDYGSLIYITLQRAKNAREAIKLKDSVMLSNQEVVSSGGEGGNKGEVKAYELYHPKTKKVISKKNHQGADHGKD